MWTDNLTMKQAMRLVREGTTTWHEAKELANWLEEHERALREALEPFAGKTERLESWGVRDDCEVDDCHFTIADFKRVDSALGLAQEE